MAAEVAAPRPSRPASRRRWSLVVVVVLAVALGGAAIGGWRWRRQAVARAELPPLPALGTASPALQARLRAADARARAHPREAAAIAGLGRVYHANNVVPAAKRCWQILRTLQPMEPRWPYYLADLAATEADDDAVGDDLATTVRLAPTYAPAWLGLAEFEFKRGGYEAAERAYRRRLELVPRDPYAQLGLARGALHGGDRVGAKRILLELLHDSGDFSAAHNLYAELAEADGDRDTAAHQRWLGTVAGRFRAAPDPWKEELRPYCEDADQLVIWGEVELQTKHGDHGKAYLEHAVAIAPADALAWEKLGEYWTDVGDRAHAQAAYRKGWELPGGSEIVGSALNDTYLVAGHPADGLRLMDEGLRRMPDSSLLADARGNDLAALGRLDEAIASYRTAIAKSANNPMPLANLGLALLQRGERQEGRGYLRQALAVQPGFSKALVAEAHLELEDGDFAAAGRLIFPYFEQFPGLKNARALLADFYLAKAVTANRRGQPAEAEKSCRDGLAVIAESPQLHGFLGVQLLQRGELPTAISELEASHRADANDPRGIAALTAAYVQARRFSEARRLVESAEAAAKARGDGRNAQRYREELRALPRG